MRTRGSGQDTAERYEQNLVVGGRSKIGETYYLGSVFEGFLYEMFFPAMAQKEMEEQFIRLQQLNQSVDEYAAEFLTLS